MNSPQSSPILGPVRTVTYGSLAAIFVALVSCSAPVSYTSDARYTVSRALSRTVVRPGEAVELTVALAHGSAAPLHLAYFVEHIPLGVLVEGMQAQVDGVDVSDQISQEVSSVGEVWEGCYSHRFVIQDPLRVASGFTIASDCVLTLTLRASQPGLYDLGRNDWAAFSGGIEPCFGWGGEALQLVCTDARGRVPVSFDVTTELSTVEAGQRPSIVQTHGSQAFGGLLPESVEVVFSGGDLAFEELQAGATIGSARFNVDYFSPGPPSDILARGQIGLNIVVQEVAPVLRCLGIVESCPPSVVDLLRKVGVLHASESPVGRALVSLSAEAPARRLAFRIEPGLSVPSPVAWATFFAWEIEAGLFKLPADDSLQVTTVYETSGVPSTEHTETFLLEADGGPLFRRGDANGDGRLDISDAVYSFRHLFLGGPLSCEEAADCDDDGSLALTDVMYFLAFLFQSGAPLPAPGVRCGSDPTGDDLTCSAYAFCE